MELKTYNSITVARYMLALSSERDIKLNVTQIQKLLYIVYGYFLANYNHRIFDEQPKTWPYGPVFPKTRNKVDFSTRYKITDDEFIEIKSDKILTDIIISVTGKYSKYSAAQLSEWSHMEGSPWELTTKQQGFNWNQPIPDNLIKNYFEELNV